MSTTGPESIHITDIRAALASLGIGHDDVQRVSIYTENVLVVRLHRNESGHVDVAGDEPATDTTLIPIDWSSE